jgi:hypothetical protein
VISRPVILSFGIAPKLVLRRRRTAAAEPGQIDRPVVARCFARQKIAPGFYRDLGFPDILQKCFFAVEASPTSGVEEFSQIVEPSLGKIAPARDNFAPFGHVQLRCHKFARKREGTRKQLNESLEHDQYILWKTWGKSSGHRIDDAVARTTARNPAICLKRKDPSGGTTGRVKPYGRLGWMGARARYSCQGGMTAPNTDKSRPG